VLLGSSTRSPLRWREIPGSIWAIGLVSLFMDVSSEMIHALLPVYLVTVLGASTLTVGLIEGVAEAAASITKVFSGALSDWLGRRKALTVVGYGLAALTKPVFPLASSVGWLVAARFVDRVGKGIRGAPRDALVADLSPPALRGASYGLRQTLDTVGAFLGPLAALGLMLWTGGRFTLIFWIAVVPAFLSVAVLVLAVREADRAPSRGSMRPPLAPAELARLGPSYWLVVAIAMLFTLARFSEAFLILRAQSAGLPVALAPAVLVLMNLVYAASSWPAGVLSDTVGRARIAVVGLAALVAADLVLALWGRIAGVAAGVALWGLHMGLTQGLLAALVADTVPAERRGTAFGVFNLVTGLAALAASVIAGALWHAVGAPATFLVGATPAALALLALPLAARRARGTAAA
jgi:MFS family permease